VSHGSGSGSRAVMCHSYDIIGHWGLDRCLGS
jgi:hypothetical protein